jgi:hypothetical protein
MRSRALAAWHREIGGTARNWASALRALRYTGAALALGLLVLGVGMAWNAHEVRQVRLARLLQAELHENQILRARQAALVGRAFELAKRVDEAAVRLGGDVLPARSAMEEICQEAEAAGSTTGELSSNHAPRCSAVPRLQPATQLRAAL